MTPPSLPARGLTRALWFELLALTALAVALAAGVPLWAGEWSWSWDALNHHIYLGLIAESPRWHLDVAAASVQSYQYPYLYWPLYRISLLPISGATAGALWAGFQVVMVVPPLWLASLHLLPAQGAPWQAVFERSAACALGMASVVVLAAVGTTANDLMAAVPLLWAVAIMAVSQPSDRRAAAAAAFWGVSTAFKWSNGLAVPLLLIWWWQERWPHLNVHRGWKMSLAALAGFGLTYAPWGWQLWRFNGNPFHPFFSGLFGS